jgi:hypothetical protein
LTAKVTDAFGSAQKQPDNANAAWQEISVGDLLLPQTSVKTGDNSAVLLLLPGGHLLRVGSNTTVQLRELGQNKSFSFSVLSGRVWSVVRAANKPTKYEVETPSAVAGVEGTLFSVFYEQDIEQTAVSTSQGTVNLRQGKQEVKVTEGTTAEIQRNQKTPLAAVPSPAKYRQMWQTMRKETWIHPASAGNKSPRLDRGVEEQVNASMRRLPRKKLPQKAQPKRKPRAALFLRDEHTAV